MHNNLVIILLLCFGLSFVSAQNTQVIITGKVLERNNNLPVEYATISVLDNGSKKPLTGTITSQNGTFSLKTNATDFYIEVNFIGFETKTFKGFKIVKNKIDLKTIILSEDNQVLDEIVVRAERSQMEFQLDKKFYWCKFLRCFK